MATETCSLNIDENMQETDIRGTAVFACSAYITAVGSKLNEDIPIHWHDEFEVLYVESGTLLADVAGHTYALNEGDGLFVNSGVLMSARSREGVARVKSLVFAPALIAEANSAIEQRYVRPLVSCGSLPCVLTSSDETTLIVDAFDACSEEVFGYEIHVRENLSGLLLSIVSDNVELIGSDTLPCTDRDRLKLMIEFIKANYASDITVGDIANVCAISERECFRCFKGMLGVSPKKHLMSYRISVASGLLINTDKAIVEVASECGFDSPGYFSAIFKRLMGVTPKHYRKSIEFAEM